MKQFFEKYIDHLDDKTALQCIHRKLHKVLEEYEEGKPYHEDLEQIGEMIEHLVEHSLHKHGHIESISGESPEHSKSPGENHPYSRMRYYYPYTTPSNRRGR